MRTNVTRSMAGSLAGLLFLALSPGHCVGAQADVPGLYGKTPSELTEVFPGIANAQEGRQTEVPNWKGWKTVYLGFNGKKRLESITFVPATPISEQEARRLIETELGVSLPKANEVRAPALIAYRNMTGKIKTVNLSYVDLRTDKRINEIAFFFSIGWDE